MLQNNVAPCIFVQWMCWSIHAVQIRHSRDKRGETIDFWDTVVITAADNEQVEIQSCTSLRRLLHANTSVRVDVSYVVHAHTFILFRANIHTHTFA